MDFFAKFRELYNIAKSLEDSIIIHDDEWKDFNRKLHNYTLENLENIYTAIIHYYYIETKKLDEFPYDLKRYKNEEGVTFDPKKLPVCLQYIILKF